MRRCLLTARVGGRTAVLVQFSSVETLESGTQVVVKFPCLASRWFASAIGSFAVATKPAGCPEACAEQMNSCMYGQVTGFCGHLSDGVWLTILVPGCAQFAPAVGSYAMATKLAGLLYDQEARGAGGARTCIGGRCYRCGPASKIGYFRCGAEISGYNARWTWSGTNSQTSCPVR